MTESDVKACLAFLREAHKDELGGIKRDAWAIGKGLFGADQETNRVSTKRVFDLCKANQWLVGAEDSFRLTISGIEQSTH